MRDFMRCKGCDEPEACEIVGRCLEPAARMLTSEELADCCGGCRTNSAIETWMRRAITRFCEVNDITLADGAACVKANQARDRLLQLGRQVANELQSGCNPVALRTAGAAGPLGDPDVMGADDAQRKAEERMRHDYPILQQFHGKHALGAKAAPSCLCCGQQTHPITRPIAVQHMELPAIVVCKPCKDAAAGVLAADATRVQRMRDAIEGECDGLAIDEHHARAILGSVSVRHVTNEQALKLSQMRFDSHD